MSHDIFQDLNIPQKEAVQNTEGPVLILAGAGSGKTRTIVHRIAYLIHEKHVLPGRIVAVTFTNKSTQEMRARVLDIAGNSALDCIVKTYHSLGLYLLRELSAYINYPRDFTIWDDSDQGSCINAILKSLGHDKLTKTQVKYIAQKINSFKDNLVSPDLLPEKQNLEEMELGDILQEVYHLYEQKKIESRAMDFSDLLYQTVTIMQTFPESLETFHRRYHYFLVDEYQDTNHSQYMLIHLLSQARQNLCVVGDDDQAIYTWRGADINNILDFNRDFPTAMTVKLEENYRSTQAVLNLANDVIQKNKNRMEKSLWTQEKDGKIPELHILNSDFDESKMVAEQIEASIAQGISPSEIAVLYRVNSQSRLIEEALLQKNIKYTIFGGVSFFGRKEVKDLLAYLRFLVNPYDEAALIRLINNPSRGIGDKSIEQLLDFRNKLNYESNSTLDFFMIFAKIEESSLNKKAVASIIELHEWMKEMRAKILRKIDFGMLVEDLLDQSGLRSVLEEEDRLLGTARIENILELKNSMISFQRVHPDSLLNDYLQEISLFSNTSDIEETGDDVCLMTVHNAKGLEFDTVFVVGLDEGLFPHFLSANKDDEGEEERRLLYVAITRARRQLFLTRAKKRMMMGFVQQMKPSIFLSTIGEGLLEHFDRSESATDRASFGAKKYPSSGSIGYSNKFNQKTKSSADTYSKSFPSKNTSEQFPGLIGNKVNVEPSQPAGGFHSGDKVRHPNFGIGKIFKIEGSGDASKVHIFFNDNKTRKFILKYTRLEKV
ncbi:MAG: UvrD-helicase domain-containing protein [Spirochaetia bacterium]|nr:UvrD-helicase domain-containing protein [Spirochaetia bacterium]